MKEWVIKIKRNKKGSKRAYYFSFQCNRVMPMKLSEAELLIASGKAELVDKFFHEA